MEMIKIILTRTNNVNSLLPRKYLHNAGRSFIFNIQLLLGRRNDYFDCRGHRTFDIRIITL